ncbi:cysteine protease, putative [Entamoeba histolytica HM-1:IMSS-B]|uniref:Cysteine proteinase 3 n=6 Tax=Entamoeba histolytica TaxID=5759 RepID=CPP3_ENTH1|nr:cysteine protease, putative [Entamoeba histolytica HM-1:IMSS]P36184.2 RecName: Full=Cysteine proteinase 3; Short=EhCP3; AltName: Full=Cysteine proteinase ACP1; Flags: Precursor [Entamoeba histolytica HM-1:IMSS]EMD47138.1 cysteine protease, putative [Entamoeba histolytica KU27]EMH73674.1 cysteine protease, putative [Entamoeba histolytica HM-1:IMSS-B]EMS13787.1 cysteine protease [Entamoeba histolytica HM-3:IMSS]ENY65530.1 cysteine protease, putative [Entamoeba histolytica HM-1:IMSS-A]CAA6067|eukprot:XP_653254.1 cysteine protease, putative [Entamoeba histolytica HM-1:IMSS]
MFALILFVSLACANEVAFKQWAATHNKVFANRAEYLYRFAVFLDNKKFVEANANTELNVFADMTHEEFIQTHLGMTYEVPETTSNVKAAVKAAPESVDWRSIMNPAKDQGQCGSCWTFCTTAVLEGRVNKDLGKLYSFSEQQLVDCDASDNGCEGGHPSNSLKFIQENNGLGLESDYPYKAVAGTCKKVKNVATVTGSRRVTDGSETGLQTIIAENGPVAVGMDASRPSFQLYKKGTIYSDTKCRSRMMNHCVTAVGYGSNSNGKYWIIRNSWGTSWGDAGYFLLARDSNNMCGIGRDSNYPTGVKLI